MLQTPPEISRLFDTRLANRDVPKEERALYHKWLRFYLDFCYKNRLDPLDKTNFSAFDAKLMAKHQTESQRKQARRAMAIYYRDIAGPRQGQLASQPSGIERTPQEEAKTSLMVRNAFDSNNRFVAEKAKKPLPRHPNDQAGIHAVGDHAPDPDGKMRQNSTTNAEGMKITGADWVWVYEKLLSAIKVRHYSTKTWDVYKHWTQKFQTFTKSKEAHL